MNKQRQLIIVFAMLVLLMSWVWYPVIKEALTSDTSGKNVSTAIEIPIEIPSSPKRLVDTSGTKEWGRSPFISLQAVERQQQMVIAENKADSEVVQKEVTAIVADPTKEFKLNGIFWEQSRPSALINNEIVIHGQSFQGFIVTIIDREHLILSLDGQQFKLFMNKQSN